MSKTRDNHYVAQWYQQGFFDEGQKHYRYLDMRPNIIVLPDGRTFPEKSLFKSVTSQCFYQTDLYTTFFGDAINDEIERKLFGPIDDWGSKAVKAFIGDDVRLWMKHFQQFFEYIDAQKLRTPKGLGWLKQHYSTLSQNELMREMQGIQRINCTLWTEGYREIVSAEESETKFIVTDHPVTIYNYAVPPEHELCAGLNDPAVALKASQTIFPLNKNLCLILTNLEYANSPEKVDPTQKRTFARNFRNSMVRTDAFIRSRKLSCLDVARINFIMKARANRYIAAGKEEWLFPEKVVDDKWSDLRFTLLPPEVGRIGFGGELYAQFENGDVYYQDQFGRTEKEREFLTKHVSEHELGANDPCGCGSGKKYKKCCKNKAVSLRPSWTELSVRERNIFLINAALNILGLNQEKDWVEVRRELTDDKIARVYSVYEALWPLETDILSLLPKPDGTARAVYTGVIEPKLIAEFAIGSCLYFPELFIEHPFLHPGTVKKEFSPVEHPARFHQDFLKSVFLLITLAPLIEAGIVNLVPDPCNFDPHLRSQMMSLAQERSRWLNSMPAMDARTKWLMAENFKRGMSALPESVRRAQIKEAIPDLDEAEIDKLLAFQMRMREEDPFAAIDDGIVQPGENGGILQMLKMAPNFEMTIYLARATGAFIVTDSVHRWHELKGAQQRNMGLPLSLAPTFCSRLETEPHRFICDSGVVAAMRLKGEMSAHRGMVQDIYDFARSTQKRGRRNKLESQIAARYAAVNSASQTLIQKTTAYTTMGRIQCLMPEGGLNHINVSRMLLTSGAEQHLDSVPMAFFMETLNAEAYEQNLL
ncbi:DUF4238 domain-containing protein [Agrobacterium sp. CCNWLW71]|uniref:DUF4238 domain-containing protein n=1 Tax=unclassified Agrobacterium TaxID=2632611 RepID=UPI002FF16E90